jgi:hypothetical protein
VAAGYCSWSIKAGSLSGGLTVKLIRGVGSSHFDHSYARITTTSCHLTVVTGTVFGASLIVVALVQFNRPCRLR